MLRARLPLDERRAQLLEVGQKMFAERPYDEVAIEEVAAAVGISKGLLYHYFPSKRDFYVEIVRQAAAELLRRTEPGEIPSIEDLRTRFLIYFNYVEENSVAYKTVLRGGVGSDPE